MNSVKTAWIFDVDGVITNKLTQSANPEVAKIILSLIISGNPVAFITGRSINWLKAELLDGLVRKIEDPFSLNNVYAVAEFGGIHLEYENGKEKIKTEKSLIPPEILQRDVKDIVKDFSDSMWFEEKQTIITISSKVGYSMEKFREEQKVLVGKLKEKIERYNLQEEYQIQTDPFATNIRNKKLNKSLSVSEVIKWLKFKKIENLKFYVFGDALSDMEMAEELHREKESFVFVYVGNKEDLQGREFPFEISYTKNLFDEGALEYLKSVA